VIPLSWVISLGPKDGVLEHLIVKLRDLIPAGVRRIRGIALHGVDRGLIWYGPG
jgi:hypothetical protein